MRKLILTFVLGTLSLCAFSQELYTKCIQWQYHDSTDAIRFTHINEALDWANGGFFFVDHSIFEFGTNKWLVVWVETGFGLPMQVIYIFCESNGVWVLQATSQTRIREKIKIRMDEKDSVIVFESSSGQIGRFPCQLLSAAPAA